MVEAEGRPDQVGKYISVEIKSGQNLALQSSLTISRPGKPENGRNLGKFEA